MKTRLLILLLALSLLLVALFVVYRSKYRYVVFPARPLIVHVQPFKDIDATTVNSVVLLLQKHIPVLVVNKPIDLPAFAFYPARGRYRADSLVHFLDHLSGDTCTVMGITAADISTTKGSKADWGIMGLANCPGNSCINSTFRLSKSNKTEQLYKLCLHELGHTLGLPHCPVKTCYMRDAEGGNHKDEETGFCPSCAARLKKRGLKV